MKKSIVEFLKIPLFLIITLPLLAASLWGINYYKTSLRPALRITEYMSGNISVLPDEDTEYPDWIEIQNISRIGLNLKGYGLTDSPNYPAKWVFPSKRLEPGERIVVFASGKNRTEKSLHTNFKLSHDDQVLILTKPDRRPEDSINLQHPGRDISVQLTGDNDKWIETAMWSPGFENSHEGHREFLMTTHSSNYALRINEVMYSNGRTWVDDDGDYPDWIELKNMSDKPLDLEGCHLTDNPGQVTKWTFPSVTMKPGALLVIFTSGKNRTDTDRELHTNFSLSRKEFVLLTAPDGKIIEKTLLSESLPEESSQGFDVTGKWTFFPIPSPLRENREGIAQKLPEMKFSHEPGIYEKTIELAMTIKNGEGEIHYTLDGKDPVWESPLYKESLQLDKSRVIKARVFSGENNFGPVLCGSWFIGIKHNLPVISLISDKDDLFDREKGILVKGNYAQKDFPYLGANFWQDWEKKTRIEMYNTEGGREFSQTGGLKIFGAFSRGMDQKSLQVIFRRDYGESRLKYPLFPGYDRYSYKSIVLRTSGQDAFRTKIRDALTARLASAIGMDTQEYRPVVLYLNGRYWGLYNIREKMDKYTLAWKNRLGNPDNIDLIQANRTVMDGDYDRYSTLLRFIRKNPLSKEENYKLIQTMINLDNYMDYLIVQTYVGNVDSGNIRFWREKNDSALWEWIVFDTDYSYYKYKDDSISFWFNPKGTGYNNLFSTELTNSLLKNKQFRTAFRKRYKERLDGPLSAETVIAGVNDMTALIKDEMPAQVKRWQLNGGKSVEKQWEDIRKFARRRPIYIMRYLDKYLAKYDRKKKTAKKKEPDEKAISNEIENTESDSEKEVNTESNDKAENQESEKSTTSKKKPVKEETTKDKSGTAETVEN